MGSCAAPSAKGDDKFITTDYLQQCPGGLLALLLRRPLVGRGAGRGRLREGAESYAKALASDILR
ncbi:hypothetical protein NQ283_25965, partial [Escherichia coli]|nr:hypothetical protein [Escherichia coli]